MYGPIFFKPAQTIRELILSDRKGRNREGMIGCSPRKVT